MTDDIQLVLLPSVVHLSGQLLDIRRIAQDAGRPADAPLVNLIDALKASVARTKPSGRRPAAGKKRALNGRSTPVRRAKAG